MVAAVKNAGQILGPNRDWHPTNDIQRRFLAEFFATGRTEIRRIPKRVILGKSQVIEALYVGVVHSEIVSQGGGTAGHHALLVLFELGEDRQIFSRLSEPTCRIVEAETKVRQEVGLGQLKIDGS